MEKRAILAIGLSVLVFIFFQQFQQKRVRQTVAPIPTTNTESLVPQPEKVIPSPVISENPVAKDISTTDTQATSQKITIEGEMYKAVIDNRGAVITSWELNHYKSANNRVFEMIAGNRNGEERTYPGSLILENEVLTSLANNEFYEISVEGKESPNNIITAPATLILTLRRGDVSIVKRYSFEKDNYLANLSIDCKKADKALEGRFFLGQDIGPEKEHLSSTTKLEAVYYSGGKVRRESPPKDPQEIKRIEGDVRWVGLDMQFFSMIAIPRQPLSYFSIQKHPVRAVGLDGKGVDRELLKVTTPINGSLQYQLYLGPKNKENLKSVKSADLSGVINYGMFSFLVYPLLSSLRWIYQYVLNYGYAIIILTFLLSLLLFPFRLKQMLSMKKMQVVQPKVKAIQEKYRKYKKTDPKRAEMNQEIMGLYKEHNVNPLGGCLPLILQMPFLFAFYSLLGYSIELRQAPFIWWIHDLSAKDPYYVLPIVMGITSFISQKITPMTPGADPTQAKMMMIMPVILTVMFLNFSSGLNLYFLCSNVFQVVFQLVAERWIGDGKTASPTKAR
jgi:YidC/Oxa1 family membrane protein insertase